jgi:hypothetical protein
MQVERTIFPDERVLGEEARCCVCIDSAGMESLEGDVGVRVFRSEVLDHLVCSRFTWPVTDVSRHHHLAYRGRCMHDHSWSPRLKREKLFDDVERAEDVNLEGRAEVVHFDIFAWKEGVACRGIGDQNIDRTDLLQYGANMVQIRDRGGMYRDLDAGEFRLKRVFRRIQHLLSALNDCDMLNACLGERSSNSEADTRRYKLLVSWKIAGMRLTPHLHR